MSMSKKIKQLLIEKDTTITKLATLLGTKPQNLTNKLSRDNFTEKDLQEIAKVLDCKYEAKFIVTDENGNPIKEI
ncbi:MAG: helix-turn-helix transcriptional regulator [Clostridia bacterium]|nr:helix-turn-helix transcriptional regulator [Clostridia bacterium]